MSSAWAERERYNVCDCGECVWRVCVCVCEREREKSATFSLGSEGQLEVRSQAGSLQTQQERGREGKREKERGEGR